MTSNVKFFNENELIFLLSLLSYAYERIEKKQELTDNDIFLDLCFGENHLKTLSDISSKTILFSISETQNKELLRKIRNSINKEKIKKILRGSL